jgi:hypothetical protein
MSVIEIAEVALVAELPAELATAGIDVPRQGDRSDAYAFQETGFSDNYRVGEGLVPFRTLDEAVAGAARINADYRSHSAAARALAEEHFDSDKVLGRFLDEALG